MKIAKIALPNPTSAVTVREAYVLVRLTGLPCRAWPKAVRTRPREPQS
jgi:hypothetical protein